MYTVYVLKDLNGKFYKGMTNDLSRRLKEHLSGGTRTTSLMNNPVVVYEEKCDTIEKARKREIYLKTSAGRRFLKKLLGP